MYKVIKVDSEGFYIEDVLTETLENLETNLIIDPCPEGFYLPKWTGLEWKEGLTEEQIFSIKNEQTLLQENFLLKEAEKESMPGRIKELESEKKRLEGIVADLTEIVLTGGINEQTSEPI